MEQNGVQWTKQIKEKKEKKNGEKFKTVKWEGPKVTQNVKLFLLVQK